MRVERRRRAGRAAVFCSSGAARRSPPSHRVRGTASARRGARRSAAQFPLLRQPAEISAVRQHLQREVGGRQPRRAGTRQHPSASAGGAPVRRRRRRRHGAGARDALDASTRFPTMPFYIVGKEISLEDVRLALEKMPDRFFEHPATVLVLTNLAYAEAPWLTPKSVTRGDQPGLARSGACRATPRTSSRSRSPSLEPFLAQNWQAQVSAKTRQPGLREAGGAGASIARTTASCSTRASASRAAPAPIYDLVIASQPYRARASVEFKAKRVIAPLARALGPGGRLIGIHSHGQRPGHGDHPAASGPTRIPSRPTATICSKATKARARAGRARPQFQRLFRCSARCSATTCTRCRRKSAHLDRHLDAVRRLERRDLRRADRG